MKSSSLLLLGGGATALIAGLLVAKKKSDTTTDAIKDILAPTVPTVPTVPGQLASPKGATVAIHATGYWPYVAGLTDAERKMEGGTTDRKKRPLYTLEMFQAGKAPYVSVAGDYTIWPDGQRISLSPWPNVIFRIVDTGGHFHGSNKVFRVVGEEPLDICVDSSKTIVPKKNVTATICPGDNFGAKKGPQNVVASKFKDQTVVVGDARVTAAEAIVGAYYDALERNL